VGLTVLVLIVGTLLGGLTSSGLAASGLPITASQLAALPTLILLAALSVLVD
ncbi:MAG: molecular chaperone DnaJ, partial [Synechococcus sp. MED-G67]